MVEHLNLYLFGLINAGPYLAHWPLYLAQAAAEVLVFLVPLVLVAYWLWGPPEQRSILLTAFCAILLALVINCLIGLVYFHPRPFMVPVGHTYLTHTPDSSFPSDHCTVMVTLGMVLISRGSLRHIGQLMLLAACATAWARVFLGVHFPLDMLGAVVVAALAAAIAVRQTDWVDARIRPGAESVYRKLFAVPIRQRWVRR